MYNLPSPFPTSLSKNYHTSCNPFTVTKPVAWADSNSVPTLLCSARDTVRCPRPTNASDPPFTGDILVYLSPSISDVDMPTVRVVFGTTSTTIKFQNIINFTLGDDINNLINYRRIVGLSIRLRPLVESVTDSSQPHVTTYYGNQVDATLLTDYEDAAAADQQSAFDLIASVTKNQNSKTYPNNLGCQVRYNTFQNQYEQLTFSANNNPFNRGFLPTILASVANYNNESILDGDLPPFYIDLVVHVEGYLRQPSPIIPPPSPISTYFDAWYAYMKRWPSHRLITSAAGRVLMPVPTIPRRVSRRAQRGRRRRQQRRRRNKRSQNSMGRRKRLANNRRPALK